MMVWQQWRCGSIPWLFSAPPGPFTCCIFPSPSGMVGGRQPQNGPPASLEGTPGFSHSPTISSSSSSYLFFFKKKKKQGRAERTVARPTFLKTFYYTHKERLRTFLFTCWQEQRQQRYGNKRQKKKTSSLEFFNKKMIFVFPFKKKKDRPKYEFRLFCFFRIFRALLFITDVVVVSIETRQAFGCWFFLCPFFGKRACCCCCAQFIISFISMFHGLSCEDDERHRPEPLATQQHPKLKKKFNKKKDIIISLQQRKYQRRVLLLLVRQLKT